jgi:hypothetical protein
MEYKSEVLSIKYYHYRDSKSKPYATICSFCTNEKEGAWVSAGIAICGDKENFSKKIGRDIAFNRAFKALLSERNKYPITMKNGHALQAKYTITTNTIFTHKSMFFPKPIEKE